MDTISEPDLEEPPEAEKKKKKNNAAAAELASSSSSSSSRPPAVVLPWPAAVADRYERREWLGKGMFGDVYRAWDRVLERDVAVKRLSARTDEHFVAAPGPYLEREVESLEACRGHPNVVQILDTYAAADDGSYFIVTAYAGPMNLRKYMRRRRANGEPLGEDEVREVMAQLLAGAGHAHAAGVLHRDIVPENVIVDFDAATGRMVYKICGFGLSEPAAADDKDGFGKLACADPYRAPELFLGAKDYDGRVDTWSLGCIMAELLLGDGVPFFSAPDGEVLTEMLHVVGAKGVVTWKVASLWKTGRRGRSSNLNLGKVVASSLWKRNRERGNLKKKFPPWILSPAGFKVLKGLLHSNADRRLSAAAALRKPWFQTSDDDDGTMSMSSSS